MTDKKIAPYGSWRSPITASEVYGKYSSISNLQPCGGQLYWLESRPDGRNLVMQRSSDGKVTEVTPATINVRSRVHEYGGAEYLATDRELIFSNYADHHLYRQVPGGEPSALTSLEKMRYADLVLDASRRRLLAVREDHNLSDLQPVNSLVAIPLEDGSPVEVLVSGADFYSNPRLSPQGKRLCWMSWNHPNMPWDGSELWVANLSADGLPLKPELVAGGAHESIFQPEWSPDGSLYFISDRSGWWNLYRWRNNAVQALHPMSAEFAEAQWVFGLSRYALLDENRLVCYYSSNGRDQLALLDTRSLQFSEFNLPYSVIQEVRAGDGLVWLLAGSGSEPLTMISLDPQNGLTQVIRRIRQVSLPVELFSLPQAIEFPTAGGQSAHAFFYPPRNTDWQAPAGEKPPLLVMSHGGPTGSTYTALRYGIQYWTTRGIAVLDVNYGGSTGYGRAYRERLNGQWGIVDMADCVNGAEFLVRQGLVDGRRLAITGGSAGGYTTLCALTFTKTFQAGASHYGIGDLSALATDTHKFESHYLDGLVGPYPQAKDIYEQRSPIHHLEQLKCPIILLQGLDDHVVPPAQSQSMFEAVRKLGLPVAYLPFPGEGHGFVKFENNKRALEAELYFYARVFGFELAEPVEPVEIENL